MTIFVLITEHSLVFNNITFPLPTLWSGNDRCGVRWDIKIDPKLFAQKLYKIRFKKFIGKWFYELNQLLLEGVDLYIPCKNNKVNIQPVLQYHLCYNKYFN